jgi:MFS family permease
MILFAIAEAFRSGTHKGMIMDYLKLNNWSDHKIDYYGHTRSWSQKGSAIAALIAGVLVLYSGNYRMVFLVAVIPYLLNFVNVITYPDNLNYSATAKKKQVKSVKRVLKNFTDAIKNRNVFRIMNSSALHSAFLKAIKDYIQLVMVQIAVLVPILQVVDVKRKNGLIIGILYFFIFILTAIASKNAAKFHRLKSKNSARLTLIYGLLAGILCGVLFNYQLWIFALVAFVIIYIIENIRKPILTGILSNHVPNEILTSVISAQSLYKTIITAVLAVLFGFLSDKFGIGISLIAISAMLLLFVLLINLSSRKH